MCESILYLSLLCFISFIYPCIYLYMYFPHVCTSMYRCLCEYSNDDVSLGKVRARELEGKLQERSIGFHRKSHEFIVAVHFCC